MKGAGKMGATTKVNNAAVPPPLAQKVKEKLLLDGTFEVTNGKFLQANVREKIDALSHKGLGKSKNDEMDHAVHRMSGDFKLANQTLEFRTLAFAVPGAAVNIGGLFDMDEDKLDFHGSLMLDAKISKTH